MSRRPELSEIDRQLAEIERLAGVRKGDVMGPGTSSDAAGSSGPESARKSWWSRLPGWPTILGIAAVIDLAARFFIPASDSFVRVFEGVIFGAAAAALVLPLFRKRGGLSELRRKIHGWLAALLFLGGLRSFMWGLGAPVEIANLTIFLLGLAGLAGFYLYRRRRNDEPA